VADAGQPPGANQTLGDQALEERTDMRDEGRIKRHTAGGLWPAHHMLRVEHHVRM